MIMADKIIRLRKKNGWSQEELADKLDVSRQSVSKWEGAQAVPNLDKILQLSELFGVTTDYLLKDEIEDEEFTENDDTSVKKVTLEEANSYLDTVRSNSKKNAIATFLCITAAMPLMILLAFSQGNLVGISENVAAAIGIGILLVMVAVAVGIYIYADSIMSPYDYIEKGEFSNEYGVKGMTAERKKDYKNAHTKGNICGVLLCVVSAIPLITVAFTENNSAILATVGLLLVMVGFGVMILIKTNSYWDALNRLLSEEEFSKEKKEENEFEERVGTIYWLFFTAIYLTLSFLTEAWEKTWIVWVIAGVLYAAFSEAVEMYVEKKKNKNKTGE